MTSVVELLTRLHSRGVTVAPDAGHLEVSGPRGGLTPELRTELLARKPEVLNFLTLQERILSMRLSEFELQGLALKVEVVWASETIWFVPGDEQVRALVSEGVRRGRIWTAKELRALLFIPDLDDQHIATIAKVKARFDACVITAGSLPPEETDQTDQHAQDTPKLVAELLDDGVETSDNDAGDAA